MPVQALLYSSVFWHLFPSLLSLWTWQVFHFWDKENIIYYLKMPWSLINTDANHIIIKHLYSFLSWLWNCLFNFAFQHGHSNSHCQSEIIVSAEWHVGYWAEVLCLFNHLPITIWEPQSSLEHGKLQKSFFTSGCLCLWVSKVKFPRGRDRTKTIDEGVGVWWHQAWVLTQGSDRDLSLPPEYRRHHGC